MEKIYLDQLEPSFRLSSRSHPLHDFSSEGSWYIKRDDELSFSISGTKFRKYASLIYYLKKLKIEKVILEGSSHSNHLVGCLQLLIENQIDYELFLIKNYSETLHGNSLWLSFLTQGKNITTLTKKQWEERDFLYKKILPKEAFFLPEGGNHLFSLPGAMTLAKDIAVNQKELGVIFDHIFIDAGTGFSAAALLLSLPLYNLNPHVHIIQMAYDEKKFQEILNTLSSALCEPLEKKHNPVPYTMYRSSLAPSFGSTSHEVFSFIKEVFIKQGFLCDPIYSAKLLYSAKKIGYEKKFKGSQLCIHSGGGLTLMGFDKQLLKP